MAHRLVVSVPDEMMKDIREVASIRNVDVSWLIRGLLSDWLDAQRGKHHGRANVFVPLGSIWHPRGFLR